jgi:hypothetical protein
MIGVSRLHELSQIMDVPAEIRGRRWSAMSLEAPSAVLTEYQLLQHRGYGSSLGVTMRRRTTQLADRRQFHFRSCNVNPDRQAQNIDFDTLPNGDEKTGETIQQQSYLAGGGAIPHRAILFAADLDYQRTVMSDRIP